MSTSTSNKLNVPRISNTPTGRGEASPSVFSSGDAVSARWPNPELPLILDKKSAPYLHGETDQLPRKFGASVLILTLILLVAAVGFLGYSLNLMYNAHVLVRDGVVTEGWVDNLSREFHENDDGGGYYTYYLTYRFVVGNTDEMHVEKQKIGQGTYEALAVNDVVEIRYLPDNPLISEYIKDNAADNARVMQLALAILLLIIGVMVYLMLQLAYFIESRFLRNGQVLRAEIVKITSKRADHSILIKLKYRFVAPDGRTITKRHARTDYTLTKETLPKPGAPLAIMYANRWQCRVL